MTLYIWDWKRLKLAKFSACDISGLLMIEVITGETFSGLVTGECCTVELNDNENFASYEF